MKINEPVTNNEKHMKPGSILVSKTDLKGLITYCNKDFVEISGFAYDELRGKNHNLVRHPDMPPQAFEDLWNTVKAGRPWTGIVKNRCKNGDYYWVKANVTPLRTNGRVTEYMSVRTPPSREEVAAVEPLYRDLLSNSKATLEAKGLAKWTSRFKSLQLKTIFNTILAMLIMIFAGLAAMVHYQVGELIFMQLLLGLTLSILASGVFLTRYIVKPLDYVQEKLQQIADGNYFDWVETDRNDEIGQMIQSLKSTQIKLGFDVMDSREQASEAMRIKTALDNVSSSVMMADNNRRIIYMNKTVEALFNEAESDIQKDLPDFSAGRLMGGSIDDFHKHPEHQARLLEGLSQTHQSEIEIGGRTMRIIANPVIDEQGERLGTAVEWTDRTAEVQVEKEIAGIVAAAKEGDLSQRISLEDKRAFFKQLAQGINELNEGIESVFVDIAATLKRVANGDLTETISGEYGGAFGEAKNNVNETITNLENIVLQLRESADVINTASGEISSGNNNLSSRTEQQASSLEETASSMEELTSTVRNNADNAQQANQLAASARQTAEHGGDVVSRAVQAMDEINQASNKIAEIIGVIDEIAFQTNLLALNASVEAARAGEQGRGFAVVATEVRNLAGRSATAAKEIKELIQDSGQKVKVGAELVNESGSTLNEIVTSVKKVGDIISEIAAASQEQSSGIDQVNQAVTSMDEVTQQNAALAEQTSAAAASMNEKAREMDHMMGFFKVNETSKPSGRKRLAHEQAQPVVTATRPEDSRPAPYSNSQSSAISAKVRSISSQSVDEDEWEEF